MGPEQAATVMALVRRQINKTEGRKWSPEEEEEEEAFKKPVRGHAAEVGGAAPGDSYLRIDALVAAARRVGADAVHPGFGFVSENPAFVRALDEAGLIFIGPTAETMDRVGGKAQAKREAAKLGVPVVAGSDGGLADAAAVARTATWSSVIRRSPRSHRLRQPDRTFMIGLTGRLARGQRPFHRGLRFSRNARGPSSASSLR